jgi:hypothetical protein
VKDFGTLFPFSIIETLASLPILWYQKARQQLQAG